MTFSFRELAEKCESFAHDAGKTTFDWTTDRLLGCPHPLAFGACHAYEYDHWFAVRGEVAKAVRYDFPEGSRYLDEPGVWDARLLYLYLRAEEQENP